MTKKVILVRYGELAIKGNNRNLFVAKLLKDLNQRLKTFESVKITPFYDRILIELAENKIDEVASILKNISGMYSFSICYQTENKIENFIAVCKQYFLVDKAKTFKLECKRHYKDFQPNSQEIKIIVGSTLEKDLNMKVDVHNPDILIFLEIRKDFTYIFSKTIKTIGGLPNNSGGRVLSLISGGLDSPVASFLVAKKGQNVDYLTFITPPFTSEESKNKIVTLVQRLSIITGQSTTLYVCNFTSLMNEISHSRYENYKLIIMRRFFLKIANNIALNNGYSALVTGESLGQVASQTVEAINVINDVSSLPVLRPLITYDKEEIIKIAKQIETYETSILPFADSCSLFAPKSPIIKPTIVKAKMLEKDLIFVNDLVDKAIFKMEKLFFKSYN